MIWYECIFVIKKSEQIKNLAAYYKLSTPIVLLFDLSRKKIRKLLENRFFVLDFSNIEKCDLSCRSSSAFTNFYGIWFHSKFKLSIIFLYYYKILVTANKSYYLKHIYFRIIIIIYLFKFSFNIFFLWEPFVKALYDIKPWHDFEDIKMKITYSVIGITSFVWCIMYINLNLLYSGTDINYYLLFHIHHQIHFHICIMPEIFQFY